MPNPALLSVLTSKYYARVSDTNSEKACRRLCRATLSVLPIVHPYIHFYFTVRLPSTRSFLPAGTVSVAPAEIVCGTFKIHSPVPAG